MVAPGSQEAETRADVEPATPIVSPGDRSEVMSPGATLGRYLVIETLGRGGMGLVLRGYDPKLQREVALKVVRSDAMTPTAQARLVREARAMAKLSHPNVVAVYDVEIDADGGVVVVMEYVHGTTLWAWLREAPREWNAIVDVFRAAARGLDAAHREGLLHRDFKPDNVLVGSDGRARVSDFGLARRQLPHGAETDDEAGAPVPIPVEASMDVTHAGQIMGTPPFMAPEQHAGHELGAAADQYAYCVALWWALTSAPPFRGADMQALHAAKLLGPPVWPSKVVVPRRIVEALKRGLQPQPADRWPSIAALRDALSEDPSAQRMRRVAVAGLLGLGVLGAAWGSWAQRDLPCTGASTQLQDAWSPALRDDVERAMQATQVAYAASTWTHIEPRLQGYADAWVAMHTDACEATSVRAEQSATVLDLRMACLHRGRVELRAAVQLLREADAAVVQRAHAVIDGLPDIERCGDIDALQTSELAPPAAQADAVEKVRAELARAGAQLRAGRVADSKQSMQAIADQVEEVSWEPLHAEVAQQLAHTLEGAGEYAEAERALQKALREGLRNGQWDLACDAATMLVGVVGWHLERHTEGLAYAEMARGLVAHNGDRPLDLADLRTAVGRVYREQGKYAEAETELLAVLELRETSSAEEGSDIAGAHNDLGNIYYAQGRNEDALRELERALQLRERRYGPDHPVVAAALGNLSNAQIALGRVEDAEKGLLRSLQIITKTLGPEHRDVAAGHNNLGLVYQRMGRLDDAERELRRALEIKIAVFGPDHAWLGSSRLNLAELHRKQGRLADAEREVLRSIEVWEKTVGPEHRDLAVSYFELGLIQDQLGRHAEAERSHARALQIAEAAAGRDHVEVIDPLVGRAAARMQLGAFAGAVEDAERALAVATGGDPLVVAEVQTVLADALWASEGDRTRARSLAQSARDAYAAAASPGADEDAYRTKVGEVDEWLASHRL